MSQRFEKSWFWVCSVCEQVWHSDYFGPRKDLDEWKSLYIQMRSSTLKPKVAPALALYYSDALSLSLSRSLSHSYCLSLSLSLTHAVSLPLS